MLLVLLWGRTLNPVPWRNVVGSAVVGAVLFVPAVCTSDAAASGLSAANGESIPQTLSLSSRSCVATASISGRLPLT